MAGDYDCPRCCASGAVHVDVVDCPASRIWPGPPITITTTTTTTSPLIRSAERAPWVCSRCGTSHAPHVDQCYCVPNPPLRPPAPNPYEPVVPGTYPPGVWPTTGGTMDCGCDPKSGFCMSVACPRRIQVTFTGETK